jgi:hypothetical protein
MLREGIDKNAYNNALNANRRQRQPAKPTQAAVCVSAAVRGNQKNENRIINKYA